MATKDDLRAMLDGCRADPENDLRHLVFADFVEEVMEDAAWAEFIRLSVEHEQRWKATERRQVSELRDVRKRRTDRLHVLIQGLSSRATPWKTSRLVCYDDRTFCIQRAVLGDLYYHRTFWRRGLIQFGTGLGDWEAMQPGLVADVIQRAAPDTRG